MTVRFRSTFEQERVCPWLDYLVVEPGGIIDVPDEEWLSWKTGGWEPLDPDPAAAPALPPTPPPAAVTPPAPPAPPATPAPAPTTPAPDAKGNTA